MVREGGGEREVGVMFERGWRLRVFLGNLMLSLPAFALAAGLIASLVSE